MMKQKNKNKEIQLSLFESKLPVEYISGDKIAKVNWTETSIEEISPGELGFAIYQKDTIILVSELKKLPFKKKLEEINDVNDMPF